MVKGLYLKISNTIDSGSERYEESHKQFVSYSLLFVELIMGYGMEVLGRFAGETIGDREKLYTKMVDLVKNANRGFFQDAAAKKE